MPLNDSYLEKRIFEPRRTGRIPMRRHAEATRQPAGHADRMPDLSGPQNDRHRISPAPSKCWREAGFERIELCSPVGYADSGFGAIAKYKPAELRGMLGDLPE
jgi:hypothetical protein